MNPKIHPATAAIAAAGVFALGASTVCADPVADFYRDKTVKVISAGGAAGAHGAYAQLISSYIQKYIPGNPTVIMQYMAGAGGNKAMNYLFNATANDGAHIGVPLQDLIFNARIGVKAVKYDPARAQYLGGVDSTRTTVSVMKASGVTTLEDAKRREVIMGTGGKSGQTYVVPVVLNSLLGTKFRVVSGYRALGPIHIAMERGEVHGRAASWQSIAGPKRDWVSKGMVVNLLTVALEREPELPDVPALSELAKSDDDRALIRLMAGSAALGRAWVAFGIPADRLAALRAAYAKTVADAAFLANAKKRNLPVRPVSWQDQQKLTEEILATPEATVARLKSILGLK
jgi:tripartite-type tricarboxylate transporter receptor subunit TctC